MNVSAKITRLKSLLKRLVLIPEITTTAVVIPCYVFKVHFKILHWNWQEIPT